MHHPRTSEKFLENVTEQFTVIMVYRPTSGGKDDNLAAFKQRHPL